MATENRSRFYELVEILFKEAIHYYDSTIAIIIIVLLMLDSILINEVQQPSLLIEFFAVLILIVDIGFNVSPFSKLILVKYIFNSISRLILEKFLKAILYLLILLQVIITPPDVPITFLIPSFASIDFYILLTTPIITGLYFALFNILKISFAKKNNTNTIF